MYIEKLEKQLFLIFTFYAIVNIKKKNIEKCPFTYWLNSRGGGGTILSHFTFYAIFNINKK